MSATVAAQQQALLQALWQQRHADAMKTIATYARPLRTDGQKLMERGLKAYRSNGLELAQRALAAAYPVVAELLGAESFEALARHLWQRDPPQRGDLAQWGGALAQTVASLPDLVREEPYLADVARTEWALHCAATAADVPADPASFSLLAEHDPAAVALTLGAGVFLVASAFPVVSILQAHLRGEPTLEEAGRRLRAERRENALVWREGLKPRLRQAQAGEPAFIAALQENRALADALAAAPALDFVQWLAPAAHSGLLAGVRVL